MPAGSTAKLPASLLLHFFDHIGLIRDANTLDKARKSATLSAFLFRMGNLMVLSEVQRPTDDIDQDVEQDAAQDYGMKMDQ